MMDFSFIERSLNQWSQPIKLERFAVIPTHLIYPSNSAVMIYAEGGQREFQLSDGGGAVGTLTGAGGYQIDGKRLLRDFCQSTDFRVDGSGWITTDSRVNESEFVGMVSHLAQHSRDASIMLMKHFKPHKDTDFRLELEIELDRRFRTMLSRKGHLLGLSNKTQTFDYLLNLSGGRVLAIDAVVPETASVNSALVAHIDIRAVGRSNVEQMIVYDDRVEWKSSDLALLSMGAPPTAYSSVYQTIGALAA